MTARQKRILAAIQALELAHPQSEITPRSLWESAKDPNHPLHDEFEWDDEKAADSWRDEQARRLLRIRVTVTHEERVVHAPICVRRPDAEAKEQGYVRTTTLINDLEMSRRAMVEEVVRAARAIERARTLGVAFGLGEECDRLLADLAVIKERIAA